MLVDYHNHTPLCGHAVGAPAEYVERAVALGLAEIGFSEHSPWMIQKPDEKLAPTDEEFGEFVEWVAALQRQYNCAGSPIRVRLGIEMDYVPDRLDAVHDYLERYPWDYVIGSIHHLNGWGFDNPVYVAEFDHRDIGQVYREYFARIRALAESGLFDTVGHLDLIKKFGHRPAGDLRPLHRDIAAVLKDANMVVELNTSGRDKGAREFYPSLELLGELAAAGVPLTLGSDSHRPEEVGRYFADAREWLLKVGIRTIVAYEGRERRLVNL